jgi:hypothetical protein
MMGAKQWNETELSVIAREWKGGKHIRMWMEELPGRSENAIHQKGVGLYGKRGRTYEAGNSMTWRTIQRLLADKNMTAAQLADASGLERSHIFRELKAHHPEHLHIGGWEKREHVPGGNPAIIWTLGTGKDARRPRPKSRRIIAKAHWEKMTKERTDALDKRNAKRRIRNAEKSGKLARRDIAASWI